MISAYKLQGDENDFGYNFFFECKFFILYTAHQQCVQFSETAEPQGGKRGAPEA